MLKSIRLQNFFSFKDTTIELNPGVNILIGINGSGKSNLLNAIRLLIEGVTGKGIRKLIYDDWGGFDNIYYWGKANDEEYISIEYEFDHQVLRKYGFQFKESTFYRIVIRRIHNTSNYYLEEKIYQQRTGQSDWVYLDFSSGKGVVFQKPIDGPERPKLDRLDQKGLDYKDFDGQESVLGKIYDPIQFFELSSIRKAIEECIVYDYFDTTTNSKMRRPVISTSEKRLVADGSNLAQMLNTIKINDKDEFDKIAIDLNKVNEQYKGFDFNFIGGNIELMLDENNLRKAIHVSNISNGTLRFLCLLSIFYNTNSGNLICIDEPEVGLHPDMIHTICNAIGIASNEKQLIIATHSENILNNFKLEDIKVFEKDKDNSTIVNSLTKEQFEGWYDEFFPGNMWRAGDLGGNRW